MSSQILFAVPRSANWVCAGLENFRSTSQFTVRDLLLRDINFESALYREHSEIATVLEGFGHGCKAPTP
jgi:hypothetical protein